MRLRPRHVRTRLTLWYVAVLAATLSLYAISAVTFLYVSVREELDRTLRADAESVAEHLQVADGGMLSLRGHLEANPEAALVEIWTAERSLLYRSPRLAGRSLGERPPTAGPGRPTNLYHSLTGADGEPLRVLAKARRFGGRTFVIRVARAEAHVWEQWRRLLSGLVLGLPLTLAIAALGGHWLARRALRPLQTMASRAERITADNLTERLPVENPDDELGHLARIFNEALGRVETSFTELRRFTADASHELRTPLTSLRAVGEVALQSPRDSKPYREAIGSMLEDVNDLSRLVDSLLVLSRAEAGGEPLTRTATALLDLARNAVTLLDVLAEEKNQTITITGDASLTLFIDAPILKRALINLLDNAIKYSPHSTQIDIEVRRGAAGYALIEVRDQGCGIPAQHRDRVFERFYRADVGRGRAAGGVGLGLAIADRAVRAHGGWIELESTEGQGSVFRIVLRMTDE